MHTHMVTMLRRIKPLLTITLAALGAGLVMAGTAQQGKDLQIVPASGPLKGKVVYTNSHALLIGINEYPHLPANKQLHYAVNDVTALQKVLVERYGFPPQNITTLTDQNATKSKIAAALAALTDRRKVKADDRILIYFSGHGQTLKLPTAGDMGFLIPHDGEIDLTDFSNAAPFLLTCVPMEDVWKYLVASPAKHSLVIADACYGGLMTAPRSGGEQLNPAALAELAATPARQVLTAGGKGQKSYEDPQLGHGMFTSKLLEQLRARAATPGNVFTTADLYARLQVSVANLTGGQQRPQLGNYKTEGEFLFIATEPHGVVPPAPAPPTNRFGTVRVTSTPNGARILLDGADTGQTTPDDVRIPLGPLSRKPVEIRLRRTGYKDVIRRLSVDADDTANVELTLARDDDEPMGKRVNPVDGAEMVYIPGGTFQMGSTDAEVSELITAFPKYEAYLKSGREQPQHQQTVSGFWMYTKEVTNGEYRKFLQANPNWTKQNIERRYHDGDYLDHFGKNYSNASDGDEYPIIYVSWYAAKAYAEWAGGRLPTEAQWEYAARGRRQQKYGTATGELSSTLANYDGYDFTNNKVKPGGGTKPVGRYSANPFGLYDMAGNVYQWCSSLYQSYPYRSNDGREDLNASGSRVLRGGSWDTETITLRSAYRFVIDPVFCGIKYGFRVVVLSGVP